MVLEKWLDSNLTNASKVMSEKFGSRRNLFWHGWYKPMFADWARFCDLVVCGVKNKNREF